MGTLAIPLGSKAKAYILPTGTRATWSATATNGIYSGASPTGLTEVTAIKNAKINAQAGDADTSTRAGAPFELGVPGLIAASVDFNIPANMTDPNLILLLQAFWAQTSIAMAVLTGPYTLAGNQGLWADFCLMDCSIDQKLKDAQEFTVKIKPTNSAVPPQWVLTTGT